RHTSFSRDWSSDVCSSDLASHDRYLVERVADQVYGMFGDGRLTHLPGGVDEYLARVAESTPPSGEGRTGADQPPGERARGRPPRSAERRVGEGESSGGAAT